MTALAPPSLRLPGRRGGCWTRRELRRELRGARAAVVERASDPLSAVRGEAVLDRLRAIDAACVRVRSAAQRLAAAHA